MQRNVLASKRLFVRQYRWQGAFFGFLGAHSTHKILPQLSQELLEKVAGVGLWCHERYFDPTPGSPFLKFRFQLKDLGFVFFFISIRFSMTICYPYVFIHRSFQVCVEGKRSCGAIDSEEFYVLYRALYVVKFAAWLEAFYVYIIFGCLKNNNGDSCILIQKIVLPLHFVLFF